MIISSQLGAHRRACAARPGAAPAVAARPALGRGVQLRRGARRSAAGWSGTAGRSSQTSLLLDERSSTDLQFPMWLYYLALPVGGGLMFAALRDAPAALPVPVRCRQHDGGRSGGACGARTGVAAARTEREPQSCFLLLFFGLLAAGMPIFLVLGSCAAVLYLVSGQPLVGAGADRHRPAEFDDADGAAAVRDGGGVHALGGVAKALVDLAAAWLGGIRGSLGLVTVVACTLFAAICGSSVATALAMGTILLPAMMERGYPRSVRARRGRRVRHHRHRRAAEPGADPVRHRRRAVGAAAVPGRRAAGAVAGGGVLRLGAGTTRVGTTSRSSRRCRSPSVCASRCARCRR